MGRKSVQFRKSARRSQSNRTVVYPEGWQELRRYAGDRGISIHGKSRDQLVEALDRLQGGNGDG